MGDFVLYRNNILAENKGADALACLARQGSVNYISVKHDTYVVLFFPKQVSPLQNFFSKNSDAYSAEDFCGSSGTLIYKGRMGGDALSSLLEDFSIDQYNPEDFGGIFTVILKKNNRLYMITDPFGGAYIYQNDTKSLWSSSFLAAASSSHHLTPNKQAVYEYAFQQTIYGTDTIFTQVDRLDSLKIFEFTADGPVSYDKNLKLTFEPSADSLPSLVEETVPLLKETIEPLNKSFKNKIRSALSGGYDSRLILALLKAHHTIPQLFVYGSDDSPDVTVAKTISEGEDYPLDHIDKSKYLPPTSEEYQGIIQDNFYSLDGLPIEGIFSFRPNMDTRRKRAENGYMNLNGGGGEIFRNFFYLHEGSYRIYELINCFYARYTKDFCQAVFDEKDYRGQLHDKIKTAIGATSDRLSRQQVEYAYPTFRLRYWTSRDNNNNMRLGSFITPFMSYKLVRQALKIPLSYKNHGTFQAALITALSPELASYTSDYGYAFNEPIPTKIKIQNYLSYFRPIFLRRYSYAIQHKVRTLTLPKTLSPEFLPPCLKGDMPHMSEFFKISKIKDSGLLSRVYTMEYLFNHFKL